MVFLQQNPSKYFRFESVDVLCDQLNKSVNCLKKEKEGTNEKYTFDVDFSFCWLNLVVRW